ncbi:MAG: SusC/RagA family TonB-linked outer membrane protein [Coprobacter sp.]|nr:SusC/RagA family TonB-linked outer membrane protein [Coprobacter sp.]
MKRQTEIRTRKGWWGILFSLILIFGAGVDATAQKTNAKTSASEEVVKVTGRVYDETGQPLAGASIREGNTSNGTASGSDGFFSIMARKGSQLQISFLGLQTEYVKVVEGKELVVRLKDNSHELGQVVVTGYGKTTKDRVTGSVGIVTAEDLKGNPSASVDQLLQGKLAGVSVKMTSGQPGSEAEIRIRGTKTLTGDAEPLWVIDGVPLQRNIPSIKRSSLRTGDFSNIYERGIAGINPRDIESITVLKDASAAAIYGSQAAAGVIVVTTKRGKAGRLQMNYSGTVSFVTKPPRDANLMTSKEKLAWEQELWDEFSAEGFARTQPGHPDYDPYVHYPVIGAVGMIRSGYGQYAGMSEAEQDACIARLGEQTTDWFNVLFRTAVSHSHHLSFSGGSDKSTYYVSAGYTRNNGLVKGTDSENYNLRASVDMTPNKRISLGISTDLSYMTADQTSTYVDPFRYAYFANPYERPYNEDGSYAADNTYFMLPRLNATVTGTLPEEGFNVMREIDNTSNQSKNISANVNAQLGINILRSLKFEGLASYSYTSNISENITDQDTYTAWMDRPFEYNSMTSTRRYGSIAQISSYNQSYSLRGQLHYSQTFGIHRISAIVGSEISRTYARTIHAKRYGYDPVTGNSSFPVYPSGTPVDYNMLVRYASIMDNLTGQSTVENAMASFYGSADYVLLNRYVASFTIRTDGSNQFGSKQQFNPNGSLGFSWNIGSERFMQSLKPVLSSMTLRLSGGYTGKVNALATPYIIMRYLSSFRKTDDVYYRMGSVSNPPNPKLRWEKTFDLNASLSAGLFDDRLSFDLGFYRAVSRDLIKNAAVPRSTGFSTQSYNTSEVLNQGTELTVFGRILKTKDFSLTASVNVSYNFNKLLKYDSPYAAYSDQYVGYPIGAIITGKYTGIDPKTGLYTYQLRPDTDKNEPGYLAMSDNYYFYQGTSIAPVTGGYSINFGYKNLSLSIGGNYSIGNKIRDELSYPATYNSISKTINQTIPTSRNDLYVNHLNVSRKVVNRWTSDNPRTDAYPRLMDAFAGQVVNFVQERPSYSSVVDAALMKNISYFKIGDIRLTYSFPESSRWMRKAHIASFGVSGSVSNVLIFSNYDGIDPETPGAVYPKSRDFILGLNIGF